VQRQGLPDANGTSTHVIDMCDQFRGIKSGVEALDEG
jgi:hypothetical protein